MAPSSVKYQVTIYVETPDSNPVVVTKSFTNSAQAYAYFNRSLKQSIEPHYQDSYRPVLRGYCRKIRVHLNADGITRTLIDIELCA